MAFEKTAKCLGALFYFWNLICTTYDIFRHIALPKPGDIRGSGVPHLYWS